MPKVMIDIGHGGNDTGSAGNGLVEKDINLKVGLKLYNYLSEYDVQLGITRDTDVTLTNDARVAKVNSFSPDLCVSIHHNAAASTSARGAEVIHAHYDTIDDELANTILDKLAAVGMPKRRSFKRLNDKGSDWYFMIRRIWNEKTHAIIVEGGFVTNAADAVLLRSDEFLDKEAYSIGAAIVDFFKLRLKNDEWWKPTIERLKQEGLIENEHDGNTAVTWGEFAAVISKLLDRQK